VKTLERSAAFKSIAQKSQFNVLMSSTMFPLSLRSDAHAIVCHLGRDYMLESSKWPQHM
jgi:hypothetical protein